MSEVKEGKTVEGESGMSSWNQKRENVGEIGVAKGVLKYSSSSKTTSDMFSELTARLDTIAPKQFNGSPNLLFFLTSKLKVFTINTELLKHSL